MNQFRRTHKDLFLFSQYLIFSLSKFLIVVTLNHIGKQQYTLYSGVAREEAEGAAAAPPPWNVKKIKKLFYGLWKLLKKS